MSSRSLKLYTADEAKRRIPLVLKRVALTAIDATMILDTHRVCSRRFEVDLMALQGYISHLWKLVMIVAKEPKKQQKPTE